MKIPFSTSTSNLNLTLKAWPVIALATIGLCFLTQLVCSWFGIDLPEQKNVDIVRAMFTHCFENWKYFGVCALNTALILAILPIVEELVFRGLLFKLTLSWSRGVEDAAPYHSRPTNSVIVVALSSSCLFSAAHYLSQPFPDNAFVALAFFGVAQCWLYRKTEHIWCAILNHALFNATNLVLLLILPSGS